MRVSDISPSSADMFKIHTIGTRLPSDPQDPGRKNDMSPYSGRSESQERKEVIQNTSSARQDAVKVVPPVVPPVLPLPTEKVPRL